VPASLDTSGVRALWTGRSEGDQRALVCGSEAPAPVPPGRRLRRLHQVHGATVLAVDTPAPAGLSVEWPAEPGAPPPDADALVSRGSASCLAVLTADCAPVALSSPEGAFGAVHVGWRGLLAGVVERAVAALRALGATQVSAGLGPCIGPCCYGFAAPERELLAGRYGEGVRAETASGDPAVDLRAGVRSALALCGARLVLDQVACTACGGDYFSFRAHRDEGRQALLVWMEDHPD